MITLTGSVQGAAHIESIAVTVRQHPRQAPDGHRDLTVHLMRGDPDRGWRAVEISRSIGLGSRGLRAELGRWVKEGILCRIARGVYTLSTEWKCSDLHEPASEPDWTAASSP